MIAGMITNGYLLTADRIKRLNDAGLDHMQISIDNVMPDEVSKKSLKVLDKKLQMLAEHANFHVNINSVLGGGIHNPEDALVVSRRAHRTRIHFDCRHHPRSRRSAAAAGREGTQHLSCNQEAGKDELLPLQLVSGIDRLGRAQRLALPCRRPISVYLRGRAGSLLFAAARLSRQAAGRVHGRGYSARIHDGERLRAVLHGLLCSPGVLSRFLAGPTNYQRS